MKFKKALVILPLIALMAAACNSKQTATTDDGKTVSSAGTDTSNSAGDTSQTTPDQGTAVKPTTTTVILATENNSKESGTVQLTDDGTGKVTAILNLIGAPKGVPQPAHIHTGTCAKPGDVVYPLSSAVDGTSTTTLDTSLANILATGMIINVHKSQAAINTYVACGELVPSTSSTTGTPDTTK